MNRKKRISAILAAILIVLLLLLVYGERRFVSELTDQTLAARWADDGSFAQVSCFFSEGSKLSEDALVPLRYQLNEALVNAGIGAENESDAESGRVLVDAYSSVGTLSVASARTSTETRAVGVGGDFFLFHPMTLLSGTYFDGDDLNSDGVILDEDIAWKLFGSYNIAGMEVTIKDNVYPVRGVVRRSTGAFSSAAGEDTPTIYVSYGILNPAEDGTESTAKIENYELLIKNPVTGFGVSALTEALGMSEDSFEIVENSTRFSIGSRFAVLKKFGTRSMRLSARSLPYWENRARAYEDVAALLLVLEILLGAILACWCLALLFAGIRWCKNSRGKRPWRHRMEWAKGKKR